MNSIRSSRFIVNFSLASRKSFKYAFICSFIIRFKVVERVIAHQVSREKGEEDGVEYYVKWSGLPYSECTWEDSHLIARRYKDKIDAYYQRYNSSKIPNKSCSVGLSGLL